MSIKSIALMSGVLLAVAGVACPAMAADADYQGFKAGDILVHARGVWVAPNTYTTFASGAAAGSKVDASQSFIPELDASYFFTPHIAVEAIAGVTRHHITTDKGLDLGHVELLPPTATVQYHFCPTSTINPYVGAGLTYAVFFGEKKGSTGLYSHYDNSWDPALQAGANVHLTGNWYANVDVKQLFITTTANVNAGAATARVNLNPTLVGVGVGYKF